MAHMKHAGILIDIEGGDGSGKATQSKLLGERLRAAGREVEAFAFPRYYDSNIGKLIGELLAGKHGDFLSVSPYLSALPYALDRAGAKDAIRAALERGATVVCDRYTPSHAHQCAKLPRDEQSTFFALMETIEYNDLHVPPPDLVFYLYVPTDISTDLIKKKEKRGYLDGQEGGRDLAERNIAHQDRTRAAYLKLAEEKGWHVIECVEGSAMRSPENIHEEMWRIVQEHAPR